VLLKKALSVKIKQPWLYGTPVNPVKDLQLNKFKNLNSLKRQPYLTPWFCFPCSAFIYTTLNVVNFFSK